VKRHELIGQAWARLWPFTLLRQQLSAKQNTARLCEAEASLRRSRASESAASPRLRSRLFEARSAKKGFRPTDVQKGTTPACRSLDAGRGLARGAPPYCEAVS
jgi:hypothetical protein